MSQLPERELIDDPTEHLADHNELHRLHNLIDAGELGGGTIRLLKLPFAFDTPDLVTGTTIYTPTVGDILLDAWIEVDEAWDGTTPKADIGSFIGSESGYDIGYFGSLDGPVDLGEADITVESFNVGPDSGGNLLMGYASPVPQRHLAATLDYRIAPGKFVTTDPVKLCVSTTGRVTGSDPGSTQGSANLYLLLATPISEDFGSIPVTSYVYSNELVRPMTGAGDFPLEFAYEEPPAWLDEDGNILGTGLYRVSMFVVNGTPATDPGHYAVGILPAGPPFLISLDAVADIAGSAGMGASCVVSVGEDVIPYLVAAGLDSAHEDDTADLTVQLQVVKLL